MKVHYPEFVAYLLEYYPKDLKFTERLYWYYHGLAKHPTCTCGELVKFINLNKGYQQFCSSKCSNEDPSKKDVIKKTMVDRYGGMGVASKDILEKMKSTNKKRYGVENAMQDDMIRSKANNTCKERHGGIGSASIDILEKMKITNMERYGTDNAMKNPEIQEVLKNTNMERYGCISPCGNKEVQEKIKSTMVERYGCEIPFKNLEILEKAKITNQERYGVPWACMRPEARAFSNDSKPNQEFATLLDAHNITYEREFPVGHYSYDFKVGNILIEIDPFPTHNSTWGLFGDPKPITYHQKKTDCATENGYRCIHVWDWDSKDKIISLLTPKTPIGARQCTIQEVSKEETNGFLNRFHLQGSCGGQSVRLGLYYDGALVEVMTFGKPRYNKKCDWELLRLCTSGEYVISGGAQRLLNEFKKEHSGSIISYCDRSKFDGGIYSRLGFERKKSSGPSLHWYDGKTHITNNLLLQRGFDQLFGTSYGKGTSNEDLMLQAGFIKIYDSGQEVYASQTPE